MELEEIKNLPPWLILRVNGSNGSNTELHELHTGHLVQLLVGHDEFWNIFVTPK